MPETIENRLAELGLSLPPLPQAAGSYEHAVLEGNLLHVSGGLSFSESHSVKGMLGVDVSLEEGQEGARICLLNRLAVIKGALGSLDRVKRLVSLQGYVQSAADFYDQPAVINGASDLAIEIFGDAGRHSRITLGAAALPLNAAVEIGLVVSVRDA